MGKQVLLSCEMSHGVMLPVDHNLLATCGGSRIKTRQRWDFSLSEECKTGAPWIIISFMVQGHEAGVWNNWHSFYTLASIISKSGGCQISLSFWLSQLCIIPLGLTPEGFHVKRYSHIRSNILEKNEASEILSITHSQQRKQKVWNQNGWEKEHNWNNHNQ